MTQLDMMGNPCPIPVIRARKELEKPDSDGVLVLVDNIVAVQNLEKMAKGLGYVFSYESDGDALFRVSIGKDGASMPRAVPIPKDTLLAAPAQDKTDGVTVLITKDMMGDGSEELGRILIKGFIFSLTELPVLPKAVIFLNSGVRLAVEGSNTLADLQKLSDAGATILACGTCLNYYSLTEKLAVGEVTDMFGITGHLAAPGKLITL
jgi:selenium metabolism protein YedF